VSAVARPNGPLVLFAIANPDGGAPNDLWSREQAGPVNAWQPWRSRADSVQSLGPGQIEEPTLAVLPGPGGELVQLFLRVLGKVHLYHFLMQPPPAPIGLLIDDPMELQLPPGTIDDQPQQV
jgi:hypothetical protein